MNEKKKSLEVQFESEKQVFNDIANIKVKIDSLRTESELAKRSSDFNKAAEIDYGKIPELEKELESQNAKWVKMQEAGTLLKNAVLPESIAAVISRWTQIPIKKMLQEILAQFAVKKAILFGSYAKNTPTANSDIDLVIDSEGKLLNINFYGLLEDLVQKLEKDIDLFEISEIQKESKLYEEIQKKGVIIYEK